jgi:predicted RND superfamily exporter protein
MHFSIPGLVVAVLMVVVGLAQLAFLKQAFAKSREGLAPAEAALKEAMHAKVLKAVLAADLLVLPAVGYFVGRAIFE